MVDFHFQMLLVKWKASERKWEGHGGEKPKYEEWKWKIDEEWWQKGDEAINHRCGQWPGSVSVSSCSRAPPPVEQCSSASLAQYFALWRARPAIGSNCIAWSQPGRNER